MADVEDVVELLEQWRDATGVGRVSVAVDATRTIRALSPAAKRDLAIEVAERVAPQLVPQIRAEEGDLTSEQVSAVVDLLRRADREDIDDLVTALRTGDVDAGLRLVDDAVDAVGPAVPASATAAVEERVAEADARADAAIDDALDALRAEIDEVDASPHGDVRRPIEAEIDEAAVREAAEAAAAVRAAQWSDTSALRDRPVYKQPDVTFDISFEPIELPDPSVEVVAPLAERRDTLPGARRGDSSRSRHTGVADHHGRSPAELAPAPTPAIVAAVTATTDGYRRRRAAMAAIREHRFEDGGQVMEVIRSFARPMDRAWVAGAALDAGIIEVAVLEHVDLPATTIGRLRARVGDG